MNANKGLHVIGVLLLFMLVSVQVQALEWQNLWTTPEQQAKRQLESEQFDELIEHAPSTSWRGVGEYRKGDYQAAIASFAKQREAASLAGSATGVEQAMYNQANAHTLNENYPEAINLYDEILASNPDHADASHNRAIAEQLLEQQEQQQEQQNSGGEPQDQEGEQQDGEQSDGDNGEQSSSDQQEGGQGQSEQQKSEQQPSDNQQSGQGSSDESEQSEEDAQSAEELAEQQEQAARAMQAEQDRAANSDEAPDANTGEERTEGDMAPTGPLTEKEQANEQWLRQIPDDPAGLLQRKLQNRHLTDFPKVKDSVNPW